MLKDREPPQTRMAQEATKHRSIEHVEPIRVDPHQEYLRLEMLGYPEVRIIKKGTVDVVVATVATTITTAVDSTVRIAFPGDLILTNLGPNGEFLDTYVYGNASGGPLSVDSRNESFHRHYVATGEKSSRGNPIYRKTKESKARRADRAIRFAIVTQEFTLDAGGYLMQSGYPLNQDSIGSEYEVLS